MMETLANLTAHPGILGALVATTDGIVVRSKLSTGLDEDAAAALVSSLLAATMHLLGGCSHARMDQLILKASRGTIIVSDLGQSYLVTVTDRNVDLDQGMIEIRSAAKTLRRQCCLSV